MNKLLTLMIIGGSFPFFSVTHALGGEKHCPPSIVKTEVENVLVGGNCLIRKTTVKGNIKVGEDATLNGRQNIIGGNVYAEKARRVYLYQNEVGGNVLIKGTGSVIVRKNAKVDGDVQLEKNKTISVFDNEIKGNLQCKENKSAHGGNNTVGGNKEDQCKNF